MMANKKQPIKTHLRGSNKTGKFTHLRPLSVYSRMTSRSTTNVQEGGLTWSPSSPFCNIKVEIMNSSATGRHKRKLDDSCLDETYETPLKKPCLANCLSPDLACFLDPSDTLPEAKLVTSKSSSVVADKANKIGRSSTNEDHACGTPPPQDCAPWVRGDSHVGDRHSSPCLDVQSKSLISGAGGGKVNLGPAFDFDVDEILCLSPIDRDEELENSNGDLGQSCQTFCEDEQVQHDWGDGGDHSSCCRGQSSKRVLDQAEVHAGKNTPRGTDTERDEGYYTQSYKKAASKGSDTVASTPLDRFKKLVRKSCKTKHELGLQKHELVSPTKNPELLNDSAISLCASFKLGATNSEAFPAIPFLYDTSGEGEIWCVGASTPKLLGCHGAQQETVVGGKVTMETACQVRADVDVVVRERKTEPRFQVTFWEESNSADSFESTLPLQVQVASKVVLPVTHKLEVDTKPPAPARPSEHLPPSQQSRCRAQSSHSQSQGQKAAPRPAVFHREEDWEREKRLYVDSVTRHIVDNAGVQDGVMTELLHLMNTVANEEAESDGSQWQHPSDLTRRNYQQRNSDRSLSLNQWQNLNGGMRRRFAEIPAVFHRSHAL